MKKIKMVEDARFVALRSHSMWGFYLTGLFLLLPELVFLLGGVDTNPRIWWLLALAAWVYGMLGRIIDQKDKDGTGPGVPLAGIFVLAAALFFLMGMGQYPDTDGEGQTRPVARDDAAALSPPPDSTVLAHAVPLVARWEGLRTRAYQDIVGVWTICFGETQGVRPGQTRTEAQCEADLRRRLPEYGHGWYTALTPATKGALIATRAAAFWSFSYNVGIAGAKGSTATRRLNAGQIAGACQALGWWNKAGGRVIRGLVNRRAHETEMCMRGLA